MSLLLKVCQGTFDKASRDQRELSAALEAGYDVKVLAAPPTPDRAGAVEQVKGFEVHRYTLRTERPAKTALAKFKNRCMAFVRYFSWAKQVRAFHAAVLSGHDIYALFACWLSTLFMRKENKPKLVYDSHEFLMGINAKRSRFETFVLKHLERFLMKRCALSIMVNGSIADAVQELHHLPQRPLVIRNIANYWHLDPQVIAEKRAELLQLTGGDDDTFLVMNHGGLIPMRGQETLIRSVAANKNVNGVLMGYALDDSYLESLHALTEELGVEKRIAFLPAVPQQDIWQYAGAADVALILIHGTMQNHYWSLPNKFFENVQSRTPILCSNYPEMARLIKQYNIGLTVNPDDQAAIDAAIERLRKDKALYATFKENLVKAKKDLCWEKEKGKLVDTYKALLQA